MRRLIFTFSSNSLAQIQQQLPLPTKFKVQALLNDLHQIQLKPNDHSLYLDILAQTHVEEHIESKMISQPLFQNLGLLLCQPHDTQLTSLLSRIYNAVEVGIIKQSLQANEDLSDLPQKWDFFRQLAQEQQDQLLPVIQENSYFKKAGRLQYDQMSFHQILYYTYIVVQQMAHSEAHQKILLKSFGQLNPSSLDSYDLTILAKIIRVFVEQRGFTPNCEQLIRKFDHYLEKMNKNIENKNIENKNIEDRNIENKNIENKNIEDKNIQLEDRIQILISMQDIDFPSKIPVLCQPILSSLIPSKYFAGVINTLSQYDDPQILIPKILNQLEKLQKFEDIVLVLQSMIWMGDYNPFIFQTLLQRVNERFLGVVNIVKDIPYNQLSYCCTLFQIIHTLQVKKQVHLVEQYVSNINIEELGQLYHMRIKMQNSVDISRSEGEIFDLLQQAVSEGKILGVERQVRVSLFCVDFRVQLNQQVLLLDALGGSLFQGKKGMNRKTQWRTDLLMAHNYKYINLTEWNSLNSKQKYSQLIKYF